MMSDDQNRVDDAASPTFVPSGYQVERSVSAWQQLWIAERDRLLADEELVLDEAVIGAAMRAADANDPRDLGVHLIAAALWAQRRADEAEQLEHDYRARKQRYAERVDRLRDLIERIMIETGLPKLAATEAIARIGNAPPSLVVTDEGQIPAEWFRVERTLRRLDLKNHIRETGEIIPGVYLSSGGSILVLRRLR